jgi:hypothetical protein
MIRGAELAGSDGVGSGGGRSCLRRGRFRELEHIRDCDGGASSSRSIGEGQGVRTKPLARQTLRVLAGRGVLFDRVLFGPLHPRCKTGILLGDAPYLEC